MKSLIEHIEFVLTVDAADAVIYDAAVVIDDDRISDIGPTAAVLSRHERNRFDRIIDGSRFGMTPGFVDSHVHLSETLSRAVFPDDLDTRTWVFLWAKPFYAHVNDEDEHIGALLGCAEMLRCGTTCLLDMGAQNDPAGIVRAMEMTGIRGITGRHAADNRPAVPPPGWSEAMMQHHFFPGPEAALRARGNPRALAQLRGRPDSLLGQHRG